MATTVDASKKMIVLNCKDVPENISVETRFLSRAKAQQGKYENVYYMSIIQGQVELSPQDPFGVNNALQNLRTVRPITQATKVDKYGSVPKSITFTPVIQNINSQPPPAFNASSQGVTLKPLPATINVSTYKNTNNASFTTSKAGTQIPLSAVTIPFSNPILHPVTFSTSAVPKAAVETRNAECMTEPKAKTVDQEQQTSDSPSYVSVAIQCCIDDDFSEEEQIIEDKNEEAEASADEHTEAKEKNDFLEYVRNNSTEYKNQLRECLLCGEVCKSSKYFYGHMAAHRGPKCLCYVCGQYLENKSLLKSHYCACGKRFERALLRCPHKRCSVVSVSRLELYDHVNEHVKNKVHSCSACRKSFCTAQEFLRHLLLRAKCYTEAKRNQNRLYGLRTKADRRCRVRVFTLHSHTRRTAMVKASLSGRMNTKHLCEYCYKSFRNRYIYHRHIKKCPAVLRTLIKRSKNRRRSEKKHR